MTTGKTTKAEPGEKKPTKRTPKKNGRPPVVIDTDQLEQLAAMQCTMTEMGAFFNCHPDTLKNNYLEHIEKGRELGKRSLRAMQLASAKKGNVAMLIWLGKQYLGQSERADVNMNQGLVIMWDKELENI